MSRLSLRNTSPPPVQPRDPHERTFLEYIAAKLPPDMAQKFEELQAGFVELEEKAETVSVSADQAIYLGEPSGAGSWRIMRSGTGLVFRRLESGTWVTKSTIGA